MNQLTRVSIEGYRSIGKSAVDLKELNVLIGANRAGKSNLVSFRLISFMASGALQEHIGREGGSHSLLFRGPNALEFTGEAGFNEYAIRLFHGAPDTLVSEKRDSHFIGLEHRRPPKSSLVPATGVRARQVR